MKHFNKKERLELGVKNFLTFRGFLGEQQLGILDAYISSCYDYDKRNFPNARTQYEEKLAYVIADFPKFVSWVEDILVEAEKS